MYTVTLLILIVLCTTASSFYTEGNDGRPGCQTNEELTRPWRNNFDPTRYWVCKKKDVPGQEASCPPGTAFYETELKCVAWDEWDWTPPYDPPSLAGKE